ncbi:ATP phosphoribosyltransferase [Symbiobacterium thermophilum]|uniref:ATP phosphoribosyltransferase n=3 Tax=Symbiobacterium thermophilum TaxID=2734 RepID=HIS1_SYMTH|nr:ATP phosphoribosyltransferase [Symbiobacterium thermophilum]Q67KH5.1 RecName: Full=ATP phosphoribosyltransferase; Short=ATP-PRT; Short=ATP-PRTase [Symbiobacterium thermophilum IAM 14863]MBY6274794.1 ATP phosphoribosyltransferase [Symbiobacterium thermophilum]BAD41823.1 ATP-phosphoribosyltransferase [Symbiobacterium thermophilum IAM 14863]
MSPITIALPKGRPYAATVRFLREAGLAGPELEPEEGRSLYVECPAQGTRFIIARDSDVPTYVEYGAADLGIVGKNVLMELEPQVYELLDLGYSQCRFVLAAPAGVDPRQLLSGRSRQRVATKYPRMTEAYFNSRGLQVETIFLHGSIEVAPKVGLADLIVDIVETGRTLRENNLVVVEELWTSSMRLIANRAAYRLRAERIGPMVQRLRELVSRRAVAANA